MLSICMYNVCKSPLSRSKILKFFIWKVYLRFNLSKSEVSTLLGSEQSSKGLLFWSACFKQVSDLGFCWVKHLSNITWQLAIICQTGESKSFLFLPLFSLTYLIFFGSSYFHLTNNNSFINQHHKMLEYGWFEWKIEHLITCFFSFNQ